jgi:hypothetical protein
MPLCAEERAVFNTQQIFMYTVQLDIRKDNRTQAQGHAQNIYRDVVDH